MDVEHGIMLLEELKQRKICYCKENNLPVPVFEKPEDFLIEPPRPKARWEKRWKCSNCNTLYNFDGRSCLPDSCEYCGAFMVNT